MKKLAIIGAGGFGRETARYAADINARQATWREIIFIDDYIQPHSRVEGIVVAGSLENLTVAKEELVAVCAVGNPRLKKALVHRALQAGLTFTSIIHPSAYLSAGVAVGQGVIIGPQAVITTGVCIGNHVGINPQCGIGHDVRLGDFTTLYWSVRLAGRVRVGEGCEIGTNATVLQELAIGAGCVIGAGAVVIDSLPAQCTAVGVPARIVKHNASQGGCQ